MRIGMQIPCGYGSGMLYLAIYERRGPGLHLTLNSSVKPDLHSWHSQGERFGAGDEERDWTTIVGRDYSIIDFSAKHGFNRLNARSELLTPPHDAGRAGSYLHRAGIAEYKLKQHERTMTVINTPHIGV